MIAKHKLNFLVFFILVLSAPLFFYNLSGYGLTDWDEAWYADIARNILINKRPVNLQFNQIPYLDHPPAGFILMALSYLLFGVNEFAVRFPSALLGFLSLFITYLIGKRLFNWVVGFSASMILLSCVWFVYRARTGNLDTPLLFFYLFSFYSAIKTPENNWWWSILGFSLATLMMVKSMVGLTILLPTFLFFKVNGREFKRIYFSYFMPAFLLILAPWLILSSREHGYEFLVKMYKIGTRNNRWMLPNLLELGQSETATFLHSGIRKWYYPSILSFPVSFILGTRRKQIIPILALVVFLLVNFITNSMTAIWHLIPLYPFLGLLISFSLYEVLSLIIKSLSNNFKIFASFGLVLLVLPLSLWQIYNYRNEIQLTAKGLSNWAIVSLKTKDRPEKVFLDGPDLWPTVVYYAQRPIYQLYNQDKPRNSLIGTITYSPKPLLVLTEKWRLETDKIPKETYEILEESQGKMLIRVN